MSMTNAAVLSMNTQLHGRTGFPERAGGPDVKRIWGRFQQAGIGNP